MGPQDCPITSQLVAGPLGHGDSTHRHHLCLAVKPEAPVNLTIRNTSSSQLQLTWTSPYPKAQCLEHAVKYKSNKDTSWTVRAPWMKHPCDCARAVNPPPQQCFLSPHGLCLCRSIE